MHRFGSFFSYYRPTGGSSGGCSNYAESSTRRKGFPWLTKARALILYRIYDPTGSLETELAWRNRSHAD